MQNANLYMQEVTKDDLGLILGLTPRRIQQLAKDEIILQKRRGRYVLSEAVQAYVQYIRSGDTVRGTATKAAESGPSSLQDEKAGLTRAQRLKEEMKLKIMQGDVHRAEDVKALVGGMVATTRSRLLDLPAKIAPRILGKKDLEEVEKIVAEDISTALYSLAEYDPAPYIQRCKGYEGADPDEPDNDDSEEDD